MVKRYATLDEMYYNPMKREQPATRLQRELGYDLIAPALVLQSNAMRIVTNAYKT
jgi:hypothetical protein